MRIYTRQGDAGKTGLLGGARVGKDDLQIEALGSLDELNAALGWAASIEETREEWIRQIQVRLFDMGAELAADPAKPLEGRLSSQHVAELEKLIDTWENDLPPLKNFILPGGSELAARLHLARSAARRAERRIVALKSKLPVRPVVLQYLNRLSDLLFVAARRANQLDGVDDVPYIVES